MQSRVTLRIGVFGEASAGKSLLVERFCENLSRFPRRQRHEGAFEVEEESFTTVGPGEPGFDAVGRSVCIMEAPSAILAEVEADECSALEALPPDLRDHLLRLDGALIVVVASPRSLYESSRRWRQALALLKSECPGLLVINKVDVDALDTLVELSLERHVSDIGLIAWRATNAQNGDGTLDTLGTILDYASATYSASELFGDLHSESLEEDESLNYLGCGTMDQNQSACKLM